MHGHGERVSCSMHIQVAVSTGMRTPVPCSLRQPGYDTVMVSQAYYHVTKQAISDTPQHLRVCHLNNNLGGPCRVRHGISTESVQHSSPALQHTQQPDMLSMHA
jgi:hypothetical protein